MNHDAKKKTHTVQERENVRRGPRRGSNGCRFRFAATISRRHKTPCLFAFLKARWMVFFLKRKRYIFIYNQEQLFWGNFTRFKFFTFYCTVSYCCPYFVEMCNKTAFTICNVGLVHFLSFLRALTDFDLWQKVRQWSSHSTCRTQISKHLNEIISLSDWTNKGAFTLTVLTE